MILIVYAHEPEIKELRHLASSHENSEISWLSWRPGRTIPKFHNAKLRLILNLGFAGSLDNKLRPGQIVLVKKIVAKDFAKHRIPMNCADYQRARSFASSRNLKEIDLFTSREPVTDPRHREEILRLSGAQAVDMEAGFLLEEAEQNGIPFISFKIISDHADHSAWEDIKRDRHVLSQNLGKTVFEFLREGSWI